MKRCHCCGTDHDHASWAQLEYIGVQRLRKYGIPDCELRNCQCGSTLAVEIEEEK